MHNEFNLIRVSISKRKINPTQFIRIYSDNIKLKNLEKPIKKHVYYLLIEILIKEISYHYRSILL